MVLWITVNGKILIFIWYITSEESVTLEIMTSSATILIYTQDRIQTQTIALAIENNDLTY